MDDGRIEKIMDRRERGYLWLERELKRDLAAGTAAVFLFFVVLYKLNPGMDFWVFLLFAAIVINGVWSYLRYRRKYTDFLQISEYLEQFEKGNYSYRDDRNAMRAGVHSQIVEKLIRLGAEFDTLMTRITEEKEETKALVTDISHQLKTPVAALGMSFELMEDSQVTGEERREFEERGRKEVEKLKHLMDALMNLSRMEADMIRIRPVDESLKEMLVAAVNGVYFKARDKHIEMEMESFRDIMLPFDRKWTAEAVANVLDNAVKYSPEHTKIQIRIDPRISYVLIEIEDQGIGIPKAEYQSIFKRFYRGSRPEVEANEGAGVGLYLTRQILEEEGGSIRAMPAPQGGTIFQIMLPKNKYS